jgi:hypothetical protein
MGRKGIIVEAALVRAGETPGCRAFPRKGVMDFRDE